MNMKVNIAGVEFKNPVMTASGTFGSGAEYSEFVDLNQLGGVVTKGVANVPWAGNATPRIAEVHSGMMCDKGRGKCAVGRKCYPAYCRGTQRYDERHWLAESGN